MIVLILLLACSPRIDVSRTSYITSDFTAKFQSLNNNYLKVHLKNGQLVIIRDWEVDNNNQLITGKGVSYNTNRNNINSKSLRSFEIKFDECVLIETNSYEGFNIISPLLMTLTIFTSAFTIPCIANPKSCFGSCPTYYLHQGDSLIIQAEGFSSSISKSMEKTDIDYLSAYTPSLQNELKIELKNEALETHYIRRSEILAVSKPKNSTIYYGNKKFYATSNPSLATNAVADEKDVYNLLKFKDGKEYSSLSDSTNLGSHESIILTFDKANAASSGIVITERQSLMTTFLFYQSLAYMGSQVGTFMAEYERAIPIVRNAPKNIYDVLGGIEVSVMINNKWKKVGIIKEQGPIARDTHIIPVKELGNFSEVKLTMTKGLWRIDQVSLCTINKEVEPVIVKPKKLLNNGKEEVYLLETLNNPEKMLVNNPGTSYTLVYDLPKEGNLSLFLKSQGYYTEWVRSEWLKEEDAEMVQLIIKQPHKWLKLMSPKYKVVEAKMDSLFWASKFGNLEY